MCNTKLWLVFFQDVPQLEPTGRPFSRVSVLVICCEADHLCLQQNVSPNAFHVACESRQHPVRTTRHCDTHPRILQPCCSRVKEPDSCVLCLSTDLSSWTLKQLACRIIPFNFSIFHFSNNIHHFWAGVGTDIVKVSRRWHKSRPVKFTFTSLGSKNYNLSLGGKSAAQFI